MKILLLHGKSQSGEYFASKLSQLLKNLGKHCAASVDVSAPDGPASCDRRTEGRSWYSDNVLTDKTVAELEPVVAKADLVVAFSQGCSVATDARLLGAVQQHAVLVLLGPPPLVALHDHPQVHCSTVVSWSPQDTVCVGPPAVANLPTSPALTVTLCHSAGHAPVADAHHLKQLLAAITTLSPLTALSTSTPLILAHYDAGHSLADTQTLVAECVAVASSIQPALHWTEQWKTDADAATLSTFVRVGADDACRVVIRLQQSADGEAASTCRVSLGLSLPHVPPPAARIALSSSLRATVLDALTLDMDEVITSTLLQVAEEMEAEEAREGERRAHSQATLEEQPPVTAMQPKEVHSPRDADLVSLSDVDLSSLDEELSAEACAAAARLITPSSPAVQSTSRSGRWNFTLGLVGKPSAGKSTLYNAAIHRTKGAAAVGAQPFTTIEPNVADGVRVRVDAGPTGSAAPRAGADLGDGAHQKWSPDGRRLISVRVKDVAGLVPGAYEGRGKGNAFLNDLLDADVLLHVIDGSGKTDEGGTVVGDADGDAGLTRPAEEVRWVQGEIQRWIFDNVLAKWATVERHATRGDKAAVDRAVARLLSLFTGYNATADTVVEAAALASISLPELVLLHSATLALHKALHLLVAVFVRLRFPTLLVFNKVDSKGAAKRLAVLRERWPAESTFATSALADCRYMVDKPIGSLDLPAELAPLSVLTGGAGAGVQAVLDAAVAVRRPLIVYLVLSLSTLDEVAGSPLILRGGSTVNDLFESAKHAKALAGDFMRAEALVGTTTRVLKRDTPLAPLGNPLVVRIATSKRAPWQIKR
eukprot:CAMPEP_0170730096 /NCGR_PEP_ID=MMETSP0437-20130122/360_1 /TAXON_ID=0 /ORGANISM="Sexangularia sp." /LENGTH=819 /DNA_ID=CAMNT_0011068291 /DNA_START=45 /DNA_END=2504 /DNA_ORIENTATION=+